MKPLMYYLKKKELTYIILVAAILLPLLIYLIRIEIGEPLLGQESYLHLLKAELSQAGSLDELGLLSDAKGIFTPYDFILSFSPIGFSYFLPLLSGFFSLLLFWMILKELKVKLFMINSILGLTVLSPMYLHFSTYSNGLGFSFLLYILGFYLFIKQKKNYMYYSFLIFLLLLLMGVLHGVFLIATLLIYTHLTKKQIYEARKLSIELFLSGVLFYGYQLLQFGFPKFQNVTISLFLTFFSDIGATTGFSIFNLLLIGIGVLLLWEKKRKYFPMFILLGIISLIALFFPISTLYLLIPFQIIAAYGLYKIQEMKWELSRLKKYSIFLVIIGLFFSSITFMTTSIKSEPHQQKIEALQWLKTQEPGVVLSFQDYGYLIEQVSRKKAFLEPTHMYLTDLAYKQNLSQVLFSTRNLKKAKFLLDEASIDYIFIDEPMKNGLIWKNDEEGLLFLFRNNETFKNVYLLSGVEIWKVLRNGITK